MNPSLFPVEFMDIGRFLLLVKRITRNNTKISYLIRKCLFSVSFYVIYSLGRENPVSTNSIFSSFFLKTKSPAPSHAGQSHNSVSFFPVTVLT